MHFRSKRLLLALVALALSIEAQQQQQKAPAKGAPSNLETRVRQLVEMSEKKTILKLNGNKFREYVKATPRNYSTIVIFTAMAPNRQCAICRHVHDEFAVVANSFRYSSERAASSSARLFFGSVDFDEGSDVFQLLRLNTAPVIMHFPARGKPKPADTIDFQRVGISAEAIAKWIQERTDVQIRVLRPPNYSGAVGTAALALLGAAFLYAKRNDLGFLRNERMWAGVAVFFALVMISGQMWNQIRGPPFVHRGPNGGVSYVHGSSQGQFVLETYIIMGLNAAIVFGMILLAESAGGLKAIDARPSAKDQGANSDGGKKRLMAIFGLALICVFFSLLLSVFRTKAQGYPYSFLFK